MTILCLTITICWSSGSSNSEINLQSEVEILSEVYILPGLLHYWFVYTIGLVTSIKDLMQFIHNNLQIHCAQIVHHVWFIFRFLWTVQTAPG